VTMGKKSERKTELQPSAPKIDMICSTRAIYLMRDFLPFEYGAVNSTFSAIAHSPPFPPPRSPRS
jgi:hypothetical protein